MNKLAPLPTFAEAKKVLHYAKSIDERNSVYRYKNTVFKFREDYEGQSEQVYGTLLNHLNIAAPRYISYDLSAHNKAQIKDASRIKISASNNAMVIGDYVSGKKMDDISSSLQHKYAYIACETLLVPAMAIGVFDISYNNAKCHKNRVIPYDFDGTMLTAFDLSDPIEDFKNYTLQDPEYDGIGLSVFVPPEGEMQHKFELYKKQCENILHFVSPKKFPKKINSLNSDFRYNVEERTVALRDYFKARI